VSVFSQEYAAHREKERNYRLRKELFAFTDNKIVVQFWYEYQDAHDGMKWKRCCARVTCILNSPHVSNPGIRRLRGLDFAPRRTHAQATKSGNDVLIADDSQRWYRAYESELFTLTELTGNLG
jgi:hypothetical protein